MMFTIADFPRLRTSLAIALIMALLGSASVYFSRAAAQAAHRDLVATRESRLAIDDRLKRVRSEEEEIRHKSTVFGELTARGIIGGEQRLEWIELLQTIREQLQPLAFNYEFSAQRALDSAPDAAYSFRVSTMKLQATLLHEGDFVRLIDTLQFRAHAVVQVRRCVLARLPVDNTTRNSAAHVGIDCTLDWITLRTEPGNNN